MQEGGLSHCVQQQQPHQGWVNGGTRINIHFVFFFFPFLPFDLDLFRIGRTVCPFGSYIARMILVETLQKKHGITDSGTSSNANSHGPLVHAVMSNTLRVTLNAAILIFGLLGSDPQDDVRPRDIPGICLVFAEARIRPLHIQLTTFVYV